MNNDAVTQLIVQEHMYDSATLQATRTGWWPSMTQAAVDDMRRRFAVWMIVWCSEAYHIVGISRRGRLGCLNHDKSEIRRYMSLMELGGEIPQCLYHFLQLRRRMPLYKREFTDYMDRAPEDYREFLKEDRCKASRRAQASYDRAHVLGDLRELKIQSGRLALLAALKRQERQGHEKPGHQDK